MRKAGDHHSSSGPGGPQAVIGLLKIGETAQVGLYARERDPLTVPPSVRVSPQHDPNRLTLTPPAKIIIEGLQISRGANPVNIQPLFRVFGTMAHGKHSSPSPLLFREARTHSNMRAAEPGRHIPHRIRYNLTNPDHSRASHRYCFNLRINCHLSRRKPPKRARPNRHRNKPEHLRMTNLGPHS